MAKPDCDDGWLKYAHELDAALAVADFTKGARIVLREIFAQLFGPAKLRTARVSPTELARCTGQVKTGLVRAVRELVESDVLRKRPDGSYVFNKDYESWVIQGGRGHSSGSPRLSRDEVIYCRNAPVRAMAYKAGYNGQIQSENGNQTVTDGNQIVTPEIVDEVTKLLPEGNQIVTASVTGSLPDVAPPPAPPLVNGCAEFETRETIETHTEEARVYPPSDPDDEPFASPGTETPPDRLAVENDPGEVLRVAAIAERFFPTRDYGQKVQELAGDAPMWIVEAALWEFKDSGKKSWSYFNGILVRMMGEPETVKRRPKSPRQVATAAPKKYATAPADWRPNFLKQTPDTDTETEENRRGQ
jgi:hypothetical protein